MDQMFSWMLMERYIDLRERERESVEDGEKGHERGACAFLG